MSKLDWYSRPGKAQPSKESSKRLTILHFRPLAGPLVHRAILFEDSTVEEDTSWTAFSGPPVVSLLFTHTGIKIVMIKMHQETPWNAAETISTWLVSTVVLLMRFPASTSSDAATCMMVCVYIFLCEDCYVDGCAFLNPLSLTMV